MDFVSKEAFMGPLSVSLMNLIGKRIRIIGSPQNGPEYLYEALDFLAQGKVETIVETYPLAQQASDTGSNDRILNQAPAR